ncbi:MAG: TRAP transporter small permease [Ahrensia sp.]|nr:TRAP transporter small permease [Ahrensia sp.]
MAGHQAGAIAPTGQNPFLRAVAALSTLAGWISAAMIVASVFITCQMIWIRFVMNGNTFWQTEAVIYLMIAATLLGLSYVQRLRGHVNVDLIPLALPRRARKGLAVVTLTLSIIIVAVMVWYGYEFWHVAWARGWTSESVWAIKLWIPYLAVPVGLGLFLLQLIADFVALVLDIDAPFGLEDA